MYISLNLFMEIDQSIGAAKSKFGNVKIHTEKSFFIFRRWGLVERTSAQLLS